MGTMTIVGGAVAAAVYQFGHTVTPAGWSTWVAVAVAIAFIGAEVASNASARQAPAELKTAIELLLAGVGGNLVNTSAAVYAPGF